MSSIENKSANDVIDFVSYLSDTDLESIESGKVKKITQVPNREEFVKELEAKDFPFKNQSKVFRYYHLVYGMGVTRPAASYVELFRVLFPELTEIDSETGKRVPKKGQLYRIHRLGHDANNWWHNFDATFYNTEVKNRKLSTDDVIVVEHLVQRILGEAKIQPKSRLRKIAEGALKAEARIEERAVYSVDQVKKQEVKFVKHGELEIKRKALKNSRIQYQSAMKTIDQQLLQLVKEEEELWRDES